ncbi:MAG: hypothetical protein AB7U73_16405 [Pirellulales bacterium]
MKVKFSSGGWPTLRLANSPSRSRTARARRRRAPAHKRQHVPFWNALMGVAQGQSLEEIESDYLVSRDR